MLSVLVEGTLTTAPVQRTSSKGSAYVTCQLRSAGDDGETVWCSVIAFSASAAEALAALAHGDTVAIAGPASLSQWEKDGQHRVGLKVTATRVLTVYDAGMRRKAASARHGQGQDHGPGDTRQAGQTDRSREGGPAGPTRRRPYRSEDDGPV